MYRDNKRSHYQNNYYYYVNNNLKSPIEGLDYLVLKIGRKTKFLFKDKDNRIIYLSDINIISLLIELEDEIFNEVMCYLTNFITTNSGYIFNFTLEGSNFSIPLVFPNTITEQDLNRFNTLLLVTDADIIISLYDLLVLISFIINKEEIAQKANVLKESRRKRQIKKFIILSKFYRNTEYETILKLSGYPTELDKYDVYHRHTYVTRFDKKFDSMNV